MREIKFRAWYKMRECYLYDVQRAYDMISGYVKYESGKDADYYEDFFDGFLNSNQYVVEQYIGLHDKNGRKIYEGDILRVTDEDNESYIATVKWFGDEYYPAFDLEGIPATRLYDANALSTIFNSGVETCEVIGNVHDSHELLEEEK